MLAGRALPRYRRAMHCLRFLSALLALSASAVVASPLFANPEFAGADRGTAPTCSITDALAPDLAKRAAELGLNGELPMPSVVTSPKFRGRLRCARTIDGAAGAIGIALVEDFMLDGMKVRALYQGDMVLFALGGQTPAATFPTRRGEFRCYRGGAASVQCSTGFGRSDASMLILQNQNEEYRLSLAVSSFDWGGRATRPSTPLSLNGSALSAQWVNQPLARADDTAEWVAFFEGPAFTDYMLRLDVPAELIVETRFAGDESGISQTMRSAEMIALYKAMALLTRTLSGS